MSKKLEHSKVELVALTDENEKVSGLGIEVDDYLIQIDPKDVGFVVSYWLWRKHSKGDEIGWAMDANSGQMVQVNLKQVVDAIMEGMETMLVNNKPEELEGAIEANKSTLH